MLPQAVDDGQTKGQDGNQTLGALVPLSAVELESRFATFQRLTVRQRKRWLELLLNFELKNAYDVYDDRQMPVFRVREQGNGLLSFLKRIFLGPFRPFRALVTDLGTDAPVMAVQRPFRFIFHRLEVSSPDGEHLGAIQRRWSWLRRIYVIEDAHGNVIADIFGPILRPWTFEVLIDGRPQAVIRKRWSGLLKEAFTDADNFGVDIGALSSSRLKALVFAATVLIDVVHFERSKGR
jgi:uncharacterized protein YxjI